MPEETEEDASNVAFNIEFCDKAEATPGEEWIVTGDGPWFVSMSQSWLDEHFQWDGNAIYVVGDRDGTMKIASHYYTGTMQERQSQSTVTVVGVRSRRVNIAAVPVIVDVAPLQWAPEITADMAVPGAAVSHERLA